MRESQKINYNKTRFYFVLAIFVAIVLMLFYRMVQLTVLDQHFLRHQGKSRSIRMVNTPAFRGMITDRNGSPLAISTPVDSVWVNPKDFKPSHAELETLSHILDVTPAYLKKRLALYEHKSFAYLKRGVTPQVSQKVKALTLPGLYLQREYQRFYPEAQVTSQLVGFTNIDDKGQEGLELAYNDWLTGTPGKQMVVEDLMGHMVGDMGEVQKQKPGKSLTLAIDRRIQYVAFQALADAVNAFEAKAGSIVVLDSKTGEVLAMANAPSFNPNDHHQAFNSSFRNRAVTDMFEPGSTMKAFSIMSALDSGQYHPDSIIETAPGYIKVGHNWVHDEINNGTLDVTQVLQKSSNVGVTKMTLSLPPEQLPDLLRRIGFGMRTASGFPGEASGKVVDPLPNQPFVLSTLAFGYGISVTSLQLAQAYATIANHGVKMPISLLKRDKAVVGEQVMEEEAADEMLTMLESVVQPGGTGRRAQVPGYRVAGKTGTAKVAGPSGYYQHRYVGSFVGMAPVSDPRLVVAVVIFEPQGNKYYGGLVAAPAFAKVMSGALEVLNVTPDAVG